MLVVYDAQARILETVRFRTCHREVEFNPDCHGGAAPDPNSLRDLDTEAVLKALARLSATYRRVLQLFYLGELSYKETGKNQGPRGRRS